MMPGYKVGRVGRREEDIRQEIMSHGPLQATMDVHQVQASVILLRTED